MKTGKTGTRTADCLICCAVAVFAITGVAALVEIISGGQTAAAMSLAAVLAVLGLAANVRQVTGQSVQTVTIAIAKAPKEAYWRGYGDASSDALGGGNNGDTTDLRNP